MAVKLDIKTQHKSMLLDQMYDVHECGYV